MSQDLTDPVVARRFAVERWGPTAFKCPHCGHDRAYQLRGKRSRQFQCRRCRKQKSVTADTAMHGTKIPLRVWAARGEWHERGEVPTSNAFAIEHDIAPSSAWHLNQRFMAGVDIGAPPAVDFGGYAVEAFRCRRPKPTPDLPKDAHPHLAEKRAAFLDAHRRPPLVNEIVIGPGGRELVLVDMCADPETARRMNENPLVITVAEIHRGFDRWLRSFVELYFRTVCVRWIGRYLRCLLRLWGRIVNGRTRPVDWTHAVLATPHRDLSALRAAAALG